ncbi:hypothetical protein COY32_02650 [candidate division WWE3 bacterium CG_4_10_14_0_2_um_filter_41_14]|uniref:General secretion pathway GspH domain-containing protein n=1 Tax=candidate division WWE3 bacterium CG_4_10_14_0_2_um_filter_41_14 TaxID=1975072 RepID=A0A2M7TJQ4_UNCKA|nr:MAG: hypothetical protein COY32_02650 [candidate division WWE3 bacterium CG_4_10_14_0_2_um_filter_41_14]
MHSLNFLLWKTIINIYNCAMKNKKGFTLIEILLVIVVIAVFGISAVSAYINISADFGFKSHYEDLLISVRSARSMAITNTGGDTADRYGVQLWANSVILFADNGLTPFTFDNEDKVFIGDHRDTRKTYDFSGTTYSLFVDGHIFPVTLFYETGTGNFSFYDDENQIINVVRNKSIKISFSDSSSSTTSEMVILYVTGAVEEL